MSGRLVVGFGLVALACAGGTLLYLLKTSESVRGSPEGGSAGTGGEPAVVSPLRVGPNVSAKAHGFMRGGTGGLAATDAAPRGLVPNRAAKLPGSVLDAR